MNPYSRSPGSRRGLPNWLSNWLSNWLPNWLPGVWLATLLLGAASPPLAADEIRVAVASNFRQAMAAAAQRFKEDSGHEVALIPGSTGKHYAQIRRGLSASAAKKASYGAPLRICA